MLQPDGQQCGNCRYYSRQGRCHRFPPQPTRGAWEFPLLPPGQWCGEWRPLGDVLGQVTADVKKQTIDLTKAVAANQPSRTLVDEALSRAEVDWAKRSTSPATLTGDEPMATKPLKSTGVGPIDDLVNAVAAEDAVIASAITLINGIAARIQAGIDAALAGGATAAQLSVLTGTVSDITTQTSALASAVQANTPAQSTP